MPPAAPRTTHSFPHPSASFLIHTHNPSLISHPVCSTTPTHAPLISPCTPPSAMLSQLFVGVVALFALFCSASSQSCNPGQPYGPLADGSCDPYVPPVNLANPTPADHTTGVIFSDYQLSSLNSLTNFVFLVLSEDSFDNLMATFPGVNNLQSMLAANSYPAQVNFTTGQPYPSFPADPTNGIPAGLPNKPYDIVAQSGIPGVSLSTIFSNPSHNFHQTQLKINGGAENGWVYWSTGKSATMGMG